MIKGCQKKIIHVTDLRGSCFEEAYFVLRRGGDITGIGEDDMVKEAMRIADEAVASVRSRTGEKRKCRTEAMICGGAAVSFLFGVVMLIFTLA